VSDLNSSSAIAVARPLEAGLDCGDIRSGSVVTVKRADGASMTGWLVVEGRADGAGQRWAAVVDPATGCVVLSGPVSGIEVWGWSLVADVDMPSWAGELAALRWEADRAKAAAHAAYSELDCHRERLESIVDAAHEYADRAELCSAFDVFMQEQGLRTRSRDYSVTVDVTLRLSVTAGGYNADNAAAKVDNGAVQEAIYNLDRLTLDRMVGGFEITDVETR